jgi:hypothetical protein
MAASFGTVFISSMPPGEPIVAGLLPAAEAAVACATTSPQLVLDQAKILYRRWPEAEVGEPVLL